MKKIYKLLIAMSLVIMTFSTACKHDLTERLESSLSLSTLTSASDAVALVDGIYSNLLDGGYGYYSWQYFHVTDAYTDVGEFGPEEFTKVRPSASSKTLKFVWGSQYKLINRANTAINLIGGMEFDDTDLASRLIAESLYLRSLAYYDLSGLFGDIPLLLEPTTDVDFRPARIAVSEIYAQLVLDLEEAVVNLPAYGEVEVGRATKAAAWGLISKIYLRQKDWQKVADYTKKIIDVSDYDLFPVFADLWLESNRKDNEFIFVAMSQGIDYGRSSHLVVWTTPWDHSYGWGYMGNPLEHWMKFEEGDIRAQNYVVEYDGIYGKKYKLPENYDSDDPKQQVIKNVFCSKWNYGKRDVTSTYASSALNWPILRYADVLLMRAEALNELNGGPDAEAYDRINEVRTRAELGGLSGLSQSDFRDAVLLEREFELASEGFRKDDLIRHGKFEDVMTNYVNIRGYYLPTDNKVVTSDNKVFPIPQSELDLNPNLVQNPGYN